MKKTLIALGLTAAFVGAQVKTAEAHDRCFNPAGAVIGGIVAGAVIADALQPRTVYYSTPAPVYYPAPPVQVAYAPAPVVYAAPPPMVVYPRPVITFGFGFGGHHRHHSYRHGR